MSEAEGPADAVSARGTPGGSLRTGERPSSHGPRSASGPCASRKRLEPRASEPGEPGGQLTQLWHLAYEGGGWLPAGACKPVLGRTE